MRKLKSILLLIIGLAAFSVLIFSGYKLWDVYKQQQLVEEEKEAFEPFVDLNEQSGFSIDWPALQAFNPQIVAWIYMPDSDISYPIVYGNDDYYLHHSYSGEYSIYGSIFISEEMKGDFTLDNTIVYGHSADTGGMFSSLKNFVDYGYFESHPYFYILTPTQNYRCDVYAFLQQNSYHPVYSYDFGDFRDPILEQINNDAIYTRAIDLKDKNLVSLSTCDLDYGYASIERYILSAAMTPIGYSSEQIFNPDLIDENVRG